MMMMAVNMHYKSYGEEALALYESTAKIIKTEERSGLSTKSSE